MYVNSYLKAETEFKTCGFVLFIYMIFYFFILRDIGSHHANYDAVLLHALLFFIGFGAHLLRKGSECVQERMPTPSEARFFVNTCLFIISTFTLVFWGVMLGLFVISDIAIR